MPHPDLPSHPDTSHDVGHSAGLDPQATGGSRSRVLLTVGAVVLVALILVLHLIGVVGAGGH